MCSAPRPAASESPSITKRCEVPVRRGPYKRSHRRGRTPIPISLRVTSLRECDARPRRGSDQSATSVGRRHRDALGMRGADHRGGLRSPNDTLAAQKSTHGLPRRRIDHGPWVKAATR